MKPELHTNEFQLVLLLTFMWDHFFGLEWVGVGAHWVKIDFFHVFGLESVREREREVGEESGMGQGWVEVGWGGCTLGQN